MKERIWIYCSTQQDLRSIFINGVQENGMSQDQPVTLIQLTPFLLGSVEDWHSYYQIHALMYTDEIYVDMDDYDADFKVLYNDRAYLHTPISELEWEDCSDSGYGLFCRGIPVERIASIEKIIVGREGIIATIEIWNQKVTTE